MINNIVTYCLLQIEEFWQQCLEEPKILKSWMFHSAPEFLQEDVPWPVNQGTLLSNLADHVNRQDKGFLIHFLSIFQSIYYFVKT